MDFISDFLEFLLDGFEEFLSTILEYFYDLVFNKLSDTFTYFGVLIISSFENLFSSGPSLEFLPFYLGFIFVLFVVKRAFDILR